ncbi:putative PurR-regulated permease PerM [Prauserella flava]|uniref:Putative PurR-regulated permease PerM n=1 Tax=Prauserella sediminis TaxID=577680 RepID=A0A839XFN2_9PSEU|nr:putative PurR-regulated permease PerM [Prauserella sediminis]MCR3720459.1 putative PurR-regulated permease PerM [Prauserella flava]MCR3733831.1 putative PurR-regulated permease PerM [Prauserella salsuginis]
MDDDTARTPGSLPSDPASHGSPLDADVARSVPKGFRVAAALSWRFLVIVAALYVIGEVVGYLPVVVIPLSVALLLAALLIPAVHRLMRIGLPQTLAAVIVLIGGLGVVGGLLTFVIIQFTEGLPALQQQVSQSLEQIEDWLINGPLHLQQTQIQDAINNGVQFIQDNQAAVTSSALTTAGTIGTFLTGFLLTLFILIFFLTSGNQIWTFLIRGVPRNVRDRADLAGRRGFTSLINYVRATAAVAVVDAVLIGVGLWIIGVPLVVPLSTLIFLGAFVPIIGAVVTGAVAVLVALVTNGFIASVIVLAIVVGVMQVEGNVLQPLLLGRSVRLHPLAVVLAITVGLTVAGIPGALLAVPLLAVLNAGIKSLVHGDEFEGDGDPVTGTDVAGSESDPGGTDHDDPNAASRDTNSDTTVTTGESDRSEE